MAVSQASASGQRWLPIPAFAMAGHIESGHLTLGTTATDTGSRLPRTEAGARAPAGTFTPGGPKMSAPADDHSIVSAWVRTQKTFASSEPSEMRAWPMRAVEVSAVTLVQRDGLVVFQVDVDAA